MYGASYLRENSVHLYGIAARSRQILHSCGAPYKRLARAAAQAERTKRIARDFNPQISSCF
ncbi:hypothetical protein CAMGR0001_0579 [Campylobacter gracilis RM3268]|uniref:Uncharacterized protein n=1 Tax=Campylobacter gracilis RM3268 TaxID=553220 RepID=C8PHY3_9BACT|nr:hypothetical protein CAMGR0001_0579 [Campylobacter gracilis RM3268]